MEQRIIEVKERTITGTPGSRRIRSNGQIPSVVYARGEAARSVVLDTKEFIKVAEISRISQVFTLKSTVAGLDGRMAVVKEVQRDHLKGRILHVDLQALHDNEVINVDVPVKIVGEAPGVKSQGGILTIVSRELNVQCLPKLIPGEINVDVSALSLGQSIHAKDVPLPEGVKLHGNPDETIVSVVAVRVTAEEEAAATAAAAAATPEGIAAAAAAAAAPAAGAAAAAGDAAKDAGKKDAKKEAKK